MSRIPSPTQIEADIQGNVTGQVAVGAHILQIGSVHGGVVNVAIPEERPVPRLRPTPIQLLPRPFPGLLDRATESETAAAALLSARPVELLGEVGAGKTALLRHLAHQSSLSGFPDGVLYLYTKGVPAGDLLHVLFEAFYESDLPTKPSEPEIAHLLGGRRALVILDDLELQREEIERVMNVLAACTFFWAGQERRGWGEVRAVKLGGLPLDATVTLVEREMERSLTVEERAEITMLWSATGGHPLRLLQAVAMVRDDGVPLVELVRQFRSASTPDALAEASSRNLSPSQRRLLSLLTALSGALMTPHAAAALTGVTDADVVLDTLERRGLVQRQEQRYRAPQGLLAGSFDDTDPESWRERALAYFTAWAELTRDSPAEIVAEGDVLLHLLKMALESGDSAAAIRLGRRVEGACALTGRWDRWQEVVEIVRKAAEREDDEPTRAWALHQLGTASLCLGHKESSAQALREALRIRQRSGDGAGAAVTKHNLDILLRVPPALGDETERSWYERWRKPLAAAGAGVAVVAAGLMLFTLEDEPEPGSPSLDLNPGNVRFAEQTVGIESAPMVVRLTNRGPLPLSLGGVELSGDSAFRIGRNGCSDTPALDPGGECILEVAFVPPAAGAHRARLSIADGSGTTLQSAELSGDGRITATPASPAALRIDPTFVNIGSYTVGSAGGTSEIRLLNYGGTALRISAIELEGTGDSGFRITRQDCDGAELKPDDTCSIAVAFTVRAIGPQEATLLVHHEAASSPERVRLTGSGAASPQPGVNLGVGDLAFGELDVGATSGTREVGVHSVGEVPLSVGQVRIVGEHGADFMVVGPGCPGSIAPNSECTLRIRFAPSAVGPRRAELVVPTSASGNPRVVSLTGVGRAPPVARAVPQPSQLDFGDPFVKGVAVSREVQFSNQGTAPLRVTSVTVAGPNATDYVVRADRCSGVILAPGRTCTIGVGFVAADAGNRNAEMAVAGDFPGSPRQIPLHGIGRIQAIAAAQLNPGKVDFGERIVGDTNILQSILTAIFTPQTVVVRSTGTGPLTVKAVTVSGAAAGDFQVIDSNCTEGALEPGSSCRIRLNFTPQVVGTRTAVLVVEDNTMATPHRVDLVGLGAPRAPRDTTAPQTPRPLTGTVSASEAARVSSCGATRVQWSAVSDPSTPVTYVVTSAPFVPSQRTAQGNQWVPVTSQQRSVTSQSTSTEISITRPSNEGTGVVGWRVRARDAEGNESPVSAWRYLQCIVIN